MFDRKFIRDFLVASLVAVGLATYLAYRNEWDSTTTVLFLLFFLAIAFLLSFINNRNNNEKGELIHEGNTITLRFWHQDKILGSLISLFLFSVQLWDVVSHEKPDVENIVLNSICLASTLWVLMSQCKETVTCSRAGITDHNNKVVARSMAAEDIKISPRKIVVYTHKHGSRWVMNKWLVISPDWQEVLKCFEDMRSFREQEATV